MGDGDPGAVGYWRGFSAGSRIAGYRLEGQIGRGGMAVVFRAQDERLERQVALKILSPALAADETFRHRFILESRSAAAVDDPHIIPVFEAGDADGVLFIAMRYVPGGDVGALLRQRGPLPIERAAAIISGVASALDTAHAAGLVHRDVKPTNMLLDARVGRPDHVYLSDFGLSKGALSADLTGSDRIMGTLNYCAPEQIQGRRVDARTDEYALACAAFELLSGGPPFSHDDSTAVLYAQVTEPPPRLTSRRPDLPPTIDDVLLRAMAKHREERFASCGEFADALRVAVGLQRYAPDVATVLHQRTLAGQQDGATSGAPAAEASLAEARPDALAARLSQAREMAATGNHAASEEEFRHVYRARQRALGTDHPDTLSAWFGVAQEIAARGDHARAEEEFRRMLPYLRRSLGPYHPNTMATRCSIAREMAARGDHAGAEAVFRDVLAYLQRKPGLDHPVTVILWVNIAKEIVARGDHARAAEEFRDLLPHLKLTLGRDHPDTLAVFEWIDYLQGKKSDRPAEPQRSPREGHAAATPPAHPGEGHPGHGLPAGRRDLRGRYEHGSAQPGAAGR
ncbi:MAG TPA: serine/threonine-protein kinase [Streptosporangiaceae bacterium]|nr:serine/threonine-protein kinase [Streptosporangiaceae bacterium]